MCSSLTDQVRSIAVVTTAVARGDLTQKIEISVEGEMSTLRGTPVNSMLDQLSAFASSSEVTKVALEVGTQGILGGQARVEGVQGTWADLTRNVNVSSLRVSVDLSKILMIFYSAENGVKSNRSSPIHLRSNQSSRSRRSRKTSQRRRSRRDA